MDRKMTAEYVARRHAEGVDAKTIYCEMRSMGVPEEVAMPAIGGLMSGTQPNPYSAPAPTPQGSHLPPGFDAKLYQAASGVKPDTVFIKVMAIIIMVISFSVFWGLGALLLLTQAG